MSTFYVEEIEMKTVGATEFKQQCLSLLNHLEPDGLVVTKHGKPVARVLPYQRGFAPLIGSLQDKIIIRGDILSTGSVWQANAES